MIDTGFRTRRLRLEIYRDTAGKWRWRSISGNGRGTATPHEGYTRRIDCLHGAGLNIGFYVDDIEWVSDTYAQILPSTRLDIECIELTVVES